MPTKSPAFRFYPSDFVGSPTVQAMDLHEVGAYTLLLCTAWNAERHGYLPDDENLLRRWARMTREQWMESRGLLLSKFPVVETGWRANPELLIEVERENTRLTRRKRSNPPKRRRIPRVAGRFWRVTRIRIFQRDEYTCAYCGRTDRPLHCDHIVPIAQGGVDDDTNLTTSCKDCNTRKGARTPEQWKAALNG